MSTIRDLSNALSARTGGLADTVQIRQGVVSAVDSFEVGTCDIYLSGDTDTLLVGVTYMAFDIPNVNDAVWVLKNGSDLLILGRQYSASGYAGAYVENIRYQTDQSGASTTSSTAYTDMADGVGPVVGPVYLLADHACTVIVQARVKISTGGAGHSGFMSFAVSGDETHAAIDANALETLNASDQTLTSVSIFAPAISGLFTFTAKYRSTSGADTFTAVRRRIIVNK